MAGINAFVKSVAVLFTGTVLAQVVTYALSPIITRQFSPDESAYLGLFLRITTLGAALATARLELAFPLEKKDHHAFGIYRFSMRFSIGLSLLSLAFLGIYSSIGFSTLKELFFLLSLPAGIFLLAFYNQGNSWALRKEQFALIARSALALSLITNMLKVAFGFIAGGGSWSKSGFVENGSIYLIAATLAGYLLSCIPYLRDYRRNRREAVLHARSSRTKALISKNSDLYTYNLPHVFIDLARDLLLASIVWNLYGKMEYGSYDHAFRMLKLPVVFIGAAIGQVFFRRCTELLNQGKSIFPLASRIVLILAGLSIFPFAIVAIWGPELFAIVFGEAWRQSGEMASIMVPWLLMNFITSPISFIAIVMKQQKAFFWVNVLGTASLILVISLPYLGFFHLGFYEILRLLSISQAVFLVVVLIWMLVIARKGPDSRR